VLPHLSILMHAGIAAFECVVRTPFLEAARLDLADGEIDDAGGECTSAIARAIDHASARAAVSRHTSAARSGSVLARILVAPCTTPEVSTVARSHTHLNLDEHLTPLSELPNYKVEPGDPDPRGWAVVTTDGRSVGRVEDLVIDTTAMKVRQLIVAPTKGGTTDPSGSTGLLDVSAVDLRKDAHQVVADAFPTARASVAEDRNRVTSSPGSNTTASVADRSTTGRSSERDSARITRAEEELDIGKREVSRGEARVSKHVETEHVTQPVTRRREEVVVERRPVEAGARADASIGSDGDIRVPLMEEELTVEKRPVVKEELIVGKRVVEDHDVVEADVRREKFDIDEKAKPGAPTRPPSRSEH
jgi:uncharacterized protein (TIGR02271 family)